MKLHEKVIVPDPQTVEGIANAIVQLAKEHPYPEVDPKFEEAVERLRPKLWPYNVAIDWEMKSIAQCHFRNGMVWVNPALFKESPNTIKNVVKHELTHRGQSERIRQAGNFDRYTRRKHTARSVETVAREKAYYADKHEMMAYAQQTVDEMLKYYSKADLLAKMKSGKFMASMAGQKYQSLFHQNDPETWHRFLKYAYEYASQIPESTHQRALRLIEQMDDPDAGSAKDYLRGMERYVAATVVVDESNDFQQFDPVQVNALHYLDSLDATRIRMWVKQARGNPNQQEVGIYCDSEIGDPARLIKNFSEVPEWLQQHVDETMCPVNVYINRDDFMRWFESKFGNGAQA